MNVDDEFGRCGIAVIELRGCLSGIRRQRGHVNQCTDLGVHTGFGDHRSTPAMSHQHRRAILPIKRPSGGSNVISQGGEGILNNGYAVASGGQVVIDTPPARSIGEGPVHKNHIA